MGTQSTLEQRVAELERQVAQMQLQSNGTPKKAWLETVGMFTDDPEMLEIFTEAMKIREADRRKTRPRAKRTKRAKS